MKIQALGRGGQDASISIGNSNFMITADSGKRLIMDWGMTAKFIYCDELGLDRKDIDAVFISHLHSDHACLESLAFNRHFAPKRDENKVRVKMKLFMIRPLMEELWKKTLSGGLESIEGKVMHLTDYFDCRPINENKTFKWEGLCFTPVQTVHVRSGFIIKNSFGLSISKELSKDVWGSGSVYITSDTQFDRGLMPFYRDAKLILQDCETGPFKSVVHAHYDDLKTLPEYVRNKMWLYHYNKPEPTFKEDGFAGFVEKGQVFEV